ncbi:MAG: alpha/beta fold hydrolase [Anaerolineales bacterium]|nr:alpha/beta fold hydrolase [Anaerolineales bacterium]
MAESQKISAGEKIWRIIKRILGFILPFVILISISVILIWMLSIYPFESKPDDRQEFLKQNWKRYLTRDNRLIALYHLEGFELTLCPFSDDGWSEDISPEEAGFICGFVTVPKFHDLPDGDTIRIPIAIWPDFANPPYKEPLFITHGGPGGSALDMYPGWFYPDRIGGGRDLVFIDQRGTQFAEPSLVCPEVTESSKNGVEDYQDYLRYCRARLTGKGIDLAAFTTPEIARDFEVVRKTLDYQKYDFYGVSYGTHVGQYLAAYYPDRIRALILDGVAPIPLDYLNRAVSTHNRVLNELIAHCEKDPNCSQQYPDLSGMLNSTIKRLDQEPQQIKIHVPGYLATYNEEIDGSSFYYYILSSSYLDNNYAALPYIIQQVEKNRFDAMASFYEAYILNFLTTSGAFYSVICADHSTLTTTGSDESVLIPTMMGWEIESQADNREECKSWNVPRSPHILDTMPISEVPTLLLSGFFDPVTPPEYGDFALESFPQGQHLIDPLGSHGVAFNDDCSRRIVEEFLDDPANPVRSGCLTDPDRRTSHVPASALSIPFFRRSGDIADSFRFLPIAVLMLMFIRSIIRGVRRVWKKHQKTWIKRTHTEWVLHRRFELASWIFMVGSFGLGVSLDHLKDQLFQLPAYWNASALPAEARWVLMIPLMLILILPAVGIPSFRLWKYNKNVFGRSYYLFLALASTGLAVFLVYSDMLFIWVR